MIGEPMGAKRRTEVGVEVSGGQEEQESAERHWLDVAIDYPFCHSCDSC
ncbi:hypothetical protein Hanom_Chr17g01546101 [Helianthus anomalus]